MWDTQYQFRFLDILDILIIVVDVFLLLLRYVRFIVPSRFSCRCRGSTSTYRKINCQSTWAALGLTTTSSGYTTAWWVSLPTNIYLCSVCTSCFASPAAQLRYPAGYFTGHSPFPSKNRFLNFSIARFCQNLKRLDSRFRRSIFLQNHVSANYISVNLSTRYPCELKPKCHN